MSADPSRPAEADDQADGKAAALGDRDPLVVAPDGSARPLSAELVDASRDADLAVLLGSRGRLSGVRLTVDPVPGGPVSDVRMV